MTFLAAAFLLGASAQCFAQLVVVAHPSAAIAADDVREIYLGEKQFQGSVKLVPVDNAALREQFLARVMKMDGARYGAVWTKKAFRDGLSAPAVKSGDVEVIEFVRRTPGAVGYVGSPPPDLRIVERY
jgi:hypothetical protein